MFRKLCWDWPVLTVLVEPLCAGWSLQDLWTRLRDKAAHRTTGWQWKGENHENFLQQNTDNARRQHLRYAENRELIWHFTN